MLKRYFIIILLISFRIVNAQDTLQYKKIILKVVPLNFIDKFSFQTAQVGFEFIFSSRYSADFSYGHVFGVDFYNHSGGNGFKARSEIRRYTSTYFNGNRNTYFALEGFFYKIDYSSNSDFTNYEDSTIYNEDYVINKNVWGINFTYGIQTNITKRFIFNTYIGIGIRIKDVQHINRTRPEDSFYSVDLLAVNVRDKQGNYATPNLTAGFKIGYILK